MRRSRFAPLAPFASLSVAAATTLLTLGGAGCGDWQTIVEDVLSHEGDHAPGKPATTDGGVAPSADAGGTCVYEGKPYPFGSMFPALDGCNACSCDPTTGVSCTTKACSQAGGGSSAGCEKIPAAGADGACVSYSTWKTTSVDICTGRGAVLSDLVFTDECDDHQSTRQAIFVCCPAAPANDIRCEQTKDADGTPCTLCTEASGVVVKTDCRQPS